MTPASWADIGLIVGVLVGVPAVLLLLLLLLDRRVPR